MERSGFYINERKKFMSFNDNDFINDELIGGGEAKPYVPRFEQDLQKAGGNLSALAQQKEAEQNAAEAVKPEEHVYETPAYEEPVQAVQQNIFENPNTDYDEAALNYVYDGDENYRYSGALDKVICIMLVLVAVGVLFDKAVFGTVENAILTKHGIRRNDQ